MSGLDGLQLDPDGYVDMDQFPDDGTDLAEADLAQLRETLHADPVEEPTPDEWDAMFDEVLAADDSGPFAVDEVEGLVTDTDGGDDLFATDAGADDDLASDDDLPADDDLASDDAGFDDGLASDDLGLDASGDDLAFGTDVEASGGLDLGADDGLDETFAADAVDDVPTDIATNDFEDLL